MHRCKTFFYVFYSCHVFHVFNVFFYFAQRFFYFKKTCIENPIKSFVDHFWDHRNELIGYSYVVYIVSPNELNKKFITSIFS